MRLRTIGKQISLNSSPVAVN